MPGIHIILFSTSFMAKVQPVKKWAARHHKKPSCKTGTINFFSDWENCYVSPTFALENEEEGNEDRSLLLLYRMNEEQQIKALEQMVGELLAGDPGFFLVDIAIRQGNNIKIFIDADQGAGIDKMVRYNRGLYKKIEEKELFKDNDFSLEVSSPGLDEPLKLHRQYLKNIGKYAEVMKKDGIKIEGKLLSASDKEIVLEEEKRKGRGGSKTGKKSELVQHVIPMDSISTTKIQIRF